MANPYFLASRLDKVIMLFGAAVGIAECIVDPGATIVIGKIFDGVQDIANGKLTGDRFLEKVQSYTCWLIGITFYSAAINTLGYFVWVSFGYKMGHKARKSLYQVFINKNTSWFDGQANLSGAVTSLFKDIQDVEVASGIITYEIIALCCGIISQLAVAFYYSWAVTLICLAGIPVLSFIGVIFMNPINSRILKSKQLLDKISEKASWCFSSLRTVKIHQRELDEWLDINKRLIDLESLNVKFRFISNLQQGLCRAIVLLIFVQGFYFGSFMVKHKGLKAGSVITVFWSCLNASAQFQLLMTHLIEWSKGSVSAQRLSKAFEVDKDQELYNSIGLMPSMEEKMLEYFSEYGWGSSHFTGTQIKQHQPDPLNEEVNNPPKSSAEYTISNSSLQTDMDIHDKWSSKADASPKGHICFSDVVFSYPSRNEIILSGLDLEIHPGQTCFVLGQSGSGKSTLAALLSGQYPWQAGEISIDGHDIYLLSRRWIEENVYICEQFPKLFEISINDNVRVGSRHPEKVSEMEVEEALKDSCAEFVQQLPDAGRTESTSSLSGGQKQRIALARARIRNAPILLFDEVTSGLDPVLQSNVLSHILSYRAGKTTIIITHDISAIPNGYPVFYIEDGESIPFSDINEFLLKRTPFSASRYGHSNFKGGSALYSDISVLENDSIEIENHAYYSKPKLNRRNTNAGKVQYVIGTELFSVYKTIPNKLYLLIGIVISVIHSVINPVFSYIFSKMVMGIFDVHSKKTTMWSMLVLSFAFIDGIVSVGKQFLNVAAEQWLRSIRSMLVERVLTAEGFSWTPDFASYYLKMLTSDTEKCSEIITLYWPGVISMCSLGLVGFIWAIATGWKLALVGSSIIPVFVALNQIYKHTTKYWTTERECRRNKVLQLMLDLTSEAGFRTVKLQHLEYYFKNKYYDTEKQLNHIIPHMVISVGIGYGLLKCFPYSLECLLIWYGMHLIGKSNYSTQQTLTVFSLLMFTIITIDQLTSSIGSIGNGFEALSRLMNVLQELAPSVSGEDEPHVTCRIDGNLPEWKKVSFHRVSKQFNDSTKVLGSFTQTFSENELVAIIGPSGVGKSTIANLLERLESPTTGEIVVDSKWDLQQISISDVRRNISMVGQSPLDFFDGTIKENLLYGLLGEHENMTSRLTDVCKSCGVHEFVMDLDHGYDTRIKSGLLSGGQQQRLGIARALIRNPKVLILDECTSALDAECKELIMDLILKLHRTQSMIIILITHQMEVAEIADRIVKL